MKFVLVRHASTEWNLTGRIQGQTDIGLSPQGRKEAVHLSGILSGLGISLIVSSDLKRAKETAEIINSVLHVPLHFDPRLRECSFGQVEGLTKQQAIERYSPTMAPNWEDQYHAYDFRPFGGEHRDDVLTRHLEALRSLASSDPEKVVVGHGRGTWTLLAELGYDPALKRGEYRLIEFNYQPDEARPAK